MRPVRVTRRLQFAAGHRLVNHEGKCAHVHGHNYVVLLSARPREGLDAVGRVVDFAVLKERFGRWIDDNWDHGFIMNWEDVILRELLSRFEPTLGVTWPKSPPSAASGTSTSGRVLGLVPTFGQKLFLMAENPTAENMAALLLGLGEELLHDTGCQLDGVELWETENCKAEVWL